jgi:hypothetical protein
MTWIGIKMPQHVPNLIWLVVSTILKNISQWEGLSHILWKIKHVPNHQSVIIRSSKSSSFSRVPRRHVAKRGCVSTMVKPKWEFRPSFTYRPFFVNALSSCPAHSATSSWSSSKWRKPRYTYWHIISNHWEKSHKVRYSADHLYFFVSENPCVRTLKTWTQLPHFVRCGRKE